MKNIISTIGFAFLALVSAIETFFLLIFVIPISSDEKIGRMMITEYVKDHYGLTNDGAIELVKIVSSLAVMTMIIFFILVLMFEFYLYIKLL